MIGWSLSLVGSFYSSEATMTNLKIYMIPYAFPQPNHTHDPNVDVQVTWFIRRRPQTPTKIDYSSHLSTPWPHPRNTVPKRCRMNPNPNPNSDIGVTSIRGGLERPKP